ncbi:MAG: hypothetical protein OXD50_09560 [Chloroflexi bacterium]|nr:hypothetical protein [Chloroflexota bacterium]
MPKQELGQLEEVPLRDVFDDEPNDFTPWLADNLDLLGGAIGLELEREGTEVPVGDFFLDILASAGDFGRVAIENQLGPTDHSHLGQLMTYAAGVNAKALVWVASTFRPEYLDTVDCLNQWAASNVVVFAVEVRALKIGDSQMGADFRALTSPKGWARRRRSTSQQTTMTDSERSRRTDFFDRLAKGALEQGLTDSTGLASVAKSKSFPCRGVKERGLKYWVDLRPTGVATVQLDVRTGDLERNLAIIKGLSEDKVDIEGELQFEPDLLPPDPEGPNGRLSGRVITFREATVSDSQDRVTETLEWCLDVLAGYQRVLEPRLRTIIDDLDAKEA